MATTSEALTFTEEAEIRMQELAEFLAKDTRVNLALTSQLHDQELLLTPGAFLMLAIPLVEGGRLHGDKPATAPSPEAVREAMRALLESLKEERAPIDERLADDDVRAIVVGRRSLFRPMRKPIELGPRGEVRSSFSVLRAIFRRFQSLAPFTG